MSNHSSGFDPEMAQMMSDTFKNAQKLGATG